MSRLPALWALCAALAAGSAAAESQRLYTEAFLSDDSDGQRERSEYLAWRRTLEAPLEAPLVSQYGLRLGHRHFADDNGSEDFAAARAEIQLQPSAPLQLQLHVDQLEGSHWSPTLGGLTAGYRPDERWYWELSAERDLVDNAASAQRQLAFNSYVLSGDYRIAPPLTVVLGALRQDVSDDNQRRGGLLRLVYDTPLQGLSLQLRGRRVLSDFRGETYFSPRRLDEGLFSAQFSRPAFGEHWVWTALAGAGYQRVDHEDATAIYRLELRLRGWFSKHLGLESKAGCANVDGLTATSADSDYRYCSAQALLIWAW